MQAYPWDLADPRKRPKRLRKKLAARWNWRRFPPKGIHLPSKALTELNLPEMQRDYVPTRKGVRRAANMFETGVALACPLRMIATDHVGPIKVSTIFLCIDHSFSFGDDQPEPVLWETMLFSDGGIDEETFRSMGLEPYEVVYLSDEQWRYTSRKAAVEHHEKLVEMLRTGLH